MHFAKISAVFLGLVAFATALPNSHERRMMWTPRSLGRRNENGNKHKDKNAATIIDTTTVRLNEESRNSEVELTILVQEKVKINEQKKTAQDNVRKNHYRNKNKNVNTIIIVVTEIIDIRDSKNHNTRYMKRQLRADNKAKEEVIIQVTEVKAITISNSHRHGTKTKDGSGLAASAASGVVANAIQTVDPNAPFTASNQTMLLPSGASAPQSQNVDLDPAAIVEEIAANLIVEQVSG